MSCTEIFAVKDGCEPILISEISNSWRGAMYVWNDIAKRYFGLNGFPFFDYEMRDRIWNAGNEKDLSTSEKIVLASTMDLATVNKDNFHKLYLAFKGYESYNKDSSIGEQAEIIQDNIDKIPDDYFIAWNQTSVNGDAWFSGFNEDEEKNICNLENAFDVISQVEDVS